MLLGFELWFWAAVIGAVLSGFANFFFKIAAKRDYHPGQFSFYGGVASIVCLAPLVYIYSPVSAVLSVATIAAFGAGCLGGMNNICKVKALQFIDTTIYFPLFKLVSPALAVVFGMWFFSETFSVNEWVGLLLGMAVPLLLITSKESGRQNNLLLGILFILITALFAATGSALSKYAIEVVGSVLWVLFVMGAGVIVGGIMADCYKGGFGAVRKLFTRNTDRTFITLALLRSVFITVAVGLIIFAYGNGGSLGVVHTINSMYILIPVVLSIIFYNEHWNLQKVVAIVLSVAALALLG